MENETRTETIPYFSELFVGKTIPEPKKHDTFIAIPCYSTFSCKGFDHRPVPGGSGGRPRGSSCSDVAPLSQPYGGGRDK